MPHKPIIYKKYSQLLVSVRLFELRRTLAHEGSLQNTSLVFFILIGPIASLTMESGDGKLKDHAHGGVILSFMLSSRG